ncbi:MAG: hypothetical protein R2731_15315 [Nocardioides sp.]
MTDVETMLRDALHAAGERSPAAGDLVGGARARLSRRRRARAAVVAAAVAVAAIPVGFALTGTSDSPPELIAPTPMPQPPQGLRAESWRDLTVQVPDHWGYGALDQWCAQGRRAAPAVQRPGDGDAQTDVGCTPTTGYGLRFEDPALASYPASKIWQPMDAERYPADAWVGFRSAAAGEHAAVLVVAADEATVEQILRSVRAVDALDPNGCAVRLSEMMTRGTTPDVTMLSVCHYDPDGWLTQSEQLSVADSQQALEALTSPPVLQRIPACRTAEPYPQTLVAGAGRGFRIVWESPCGRDRGVFANGKHYQLTADALYWAVSPGWSGSVPSSVPMPDRLRR